jgi:hypothetical protein
MRCGRPTSERHSLLAAGTPLGVHGEYGGTCTRYRPHRVVVGRTRYGLVLYHVPPTMPSPPARAVRGTVPGFRHECTSVPRTVQYIDTSIPLPTIPPTSTHTTRTAPSAVPAASWDSSLRVGRPVELVLPSAVERSPSSRLPPESISCLCAARLPSRSRFHRNPHAPSRWAKPLSS